MFCGTPCKNLIGFELIKRKVVLNKPRYVGASILEFSKYFVYDFYYNFWLEKFKKKHGHKIEEETLIQ